MIDTSALVAALVAGHEHHPLARPHLTVSTRVPAIVLAETYAQLRRTFAQPATVATRLLRPWTDDEHHVLATSATTVTSTFRRAVEFDLGGNIHDALIAMSCLEHDVSLVTLDSRQHTIALSLGANSTYLLA